MTQREPGMKEEDSVAANARIAMIRENGNLKVSATEPWEKENVVERTGFPPSPPVGGFGGQARSGRE